MSELVRTLEVRQLKRWKLDQAQEIYLDFQDRTLESFHRCAVDPVRIKLDQRTITDVLALPPEAQATLGRLRALLDSDPLIHGGKKQKLT